jgi:hypothetical protein
MSFLVELAALALAVGVISLEEELSLQEVAALAVGVFGGAVALFGAAALSYLPVLVLTFFGGSGGLAWAHWLVKVVVVLWLVWMRLGITLVAAMLLGITLVAPACAIIAEALRKLLSGSDILQALGALLLIASLLVTAASIWDELWWLWEAPGDRGFRFIFGPLGDAQDLLGSGLVPILFLVAIVGGLFLLVAAGSEREERAPRGGRRDIRVERREGPPERKKERKRPPPKDRPVMLPDGTIKLPDGTLVHRPKKVGVKQ